MEIMKNLHEYRSSFWCVFYIVGYHLIFGVSAKSQDQTESSYLMQIGSKYIQGLQFDHSLCRVFQPTLEKASVTFGNGKKFSSKSDREKGQYYVTKMRPIISKNPHYKNGLSPVRFILLNRCNPSDRRAAQLLERWSKQSGAVECESRNFFRVSIFIEASNVKVR